TSRCPSLRFRSTYGCSARSGSSRAGRRDVVGCTAWSPRAFARFMTGWPNTNGRGTTGWIGWTTTSKNYKKESAMTPNRHGSAVIDFPNELEIVTTREFDAPIELVFDVLTKPEHVSKWFAPFTCEVTKCSIDLRVGGNYHIVFVTEDG